MTDGFIFINGKDYSRFFTPTDYTVEYEFIQGGNEGMLQNYEWKDDEVAQKAVVTLYCMPLSQEDMSALLTELLDCDAMSLTLQYPDIKTGTDRKINIRRDKSKFKQGYCGVGTDGKKYWKGTVLTLMER